MPEMDFESLLADFNQAYQEAEEFSDWMPPDDEYLVVVSKIKSDSTEKDGKKMCWWIVTGQIIAPESEDLNGREFPVGRFNTNALGILKGQVKALNKGKGIESILEANQVIQASKGKALKVKVSTTVSKKNGQEYTNCYIQEVLEGTSSQPSEPSQDDINNGNGDDGIPF